MSRRVILAIDQGTTNTKALLVDEAGGIVSRASAPVSIAFPQPAWVEQEPKALWASVQEAVEACLAAAGSGVNLAAVAVSNQRETVMVWRRATGEPEGPAVVWQCRRTTPFCDELRARGAAPMVYNRTGLTLDPLFSASKIRWLLERIQDGPARAAAGELCAGTVDSWVLWNLTGGRAHATDFTNASRTQLFNLERLVWDPELAELFGIPLPAMPAPCPSGRVFGETAKVGALPAGIPVASLIGDSHAAWVGHASFTSGGVKATYGTGSSLMMPTDRVVLSARGLSSTIAYALPGKTVYALEGNILVTGAAVQWLGDLLGLRDGAGGAAALAGSLEDAGGVYLVPAFVGLGAPHWNDRARGLLTGLTRGTTAAHLARAAVEAIAYQIGDVFAAMRADAGLDLPALLADGGGSRNDTLMQFQADILGRPVLRSISADLSALGAAYLAGLAVGVWASLAEIEALPRAHTRFEPRMAPQRREQMLGGWRAAVARATYEATP